MLLNWAVDVFGNFLSYKPDSDQCKMILSCLCQRLSCCILDLFIMVIFNQWKFLFSWRGDIWIVCSLIEPVHVLLNFICDVLWVLVLVDSLICSEEHVKMLLKINKVFYSNSPFCASSFLMLNNLNWFKCHRVNIFFKIKVITYALGI